MIRLQQLKLRTGHTEKDLVRLIADMLRCKSGDFTYQIMRRSLDARKKPELYYIYTVDVHTVQEKTLQKKLRRNKQISFISDKSYQFPHLASYPQNLRRPVIVGSGPAGMFCGLMLAREGLRPVILERGRCVEERTADVQRFWETGQLDASSNVQFGEGGAGTFSDGKLNTAIKDPESRIRFVLKTLVEAGADEQILYDYKPHVGTDVLSEVVKHIRKEIEDLGGTYLFSHCLTDLTYDPVSKLSTLTVDSAEGKKTLEADTVVLALGHSARDTFSMLHERGFSMTQKAFAMGVRVIHPQSAIDAAQYGTGEDAEHMPPAAYKLTHRLADGRGVYSFCMCPGGYVVNASSEDGRLAVNGMSYHDRASGYANSAIVATVPVSDFPDDSPLAGVRYQQKLEELAFKAGKGDIPVQTFREFCRPAEERSSVPSEAAAAISSQAVRGRTRFADVRSILPPAMASAIEEGMHAFDRQITGFGNDNTLLCAVESRTSSPVRIERTQTLEAEHFAGIYPCGEGAGYAGGITSAAVDGIRIAEAAAKRLSIDFQDQ